MGGFLLRAKKCKKGQKTNLRRFADCKKGQKTNLRRFAKDRKQSFDSVHSADLTSAAGPTSPAAAFNRPISQLFCPP
jgi:hypothetical protein